MSDPKRWFAFKKRAAAKLPVPLIEFYLRHRWWLFLGTHFTCPFCDTRFRAMVPGGSLQPVCAEKQIVGMGYQPHMTCPRCGAINRWRLLYLFLKNKTTLFSDHHSVLHVSPEAEIQRRLRACPNLDYLSVDLENPLAMRKMDITALDLPDGSRDVVLCSHVLEHIPDDRRALSEIFRVLRPGGWALLQVPVSAILPETFEDPSATTPEARDRLYGQPDHVRIYGQDYSRRLQAARFKVERLNAAVLFDTATIERYALEPREDIFLARKPAVPTR